MAVKFLTEEWATTMTDALNASSDFQSAATGQQVKLQQVVTDAPDGESKYYFTIDGGKAQVGVGEIADAEATITQNYETAVAINKQELNAQNAFMQGKLKIAGNMMKLMQLQGVLGQMPQALKDLDIEY